MWVDLMYGEEVGREDVVMGVVDMREVVEEEGMSERGMRGVWTDATVWRESRVKKSRGIVKRRAVDVFLLAKERLDALGTEIAGV